MPSSELVDSIYYTVIHAVKLVSSGGDGLGHVNRAGSPAMTLTFTTGGVICGYCSTGINFQRDSPNRVMTSAITIASAGI